jgi:hypothetical protein
MNSAIILEFGEAFFLAVAFFFAGWLWRDESWQREEDRRQARRRAHRISKEDRS